MAHPHSMMSSSEIDALIHSHLVESGYSHTSFSLLHESSLGVAGPSNALTNGRKVAREDSSQAVVPPGHLVRILQKGLLYLEAEARYRGETLSPRLLDTIPNALPLPPLPKYQPNSTAASTPPTLSLSDPKPSTTALTAKDKGKAKEVVAGKRKARPGSDRDDVGSDGKRPRTASGESNKKNGAATKDGNAAEADDTTMDYSPNPSSPVTGNVPPPSTSTATKTKSSKSNNNTESVSPAVSRAVSPVTSRNSQKSTSSSASALKKKSTTTTTSSTTASKAETKGQSAPTTPGLGGPFASRASTVEMSKSESVQDSKSAKKGEASLGKPKLEEGELEPEEEVAPLSMEGVKVLTVDDLSVIRLRGHTTPKVQPCSWNTAKVPAVLATGGGDSTCRIWDIPAPTAITGTNGEGLIIKDNIVCKHSSAQRRADVAAVAWDPSGSLLATGSEDGIARIWTPSGDLHLVLSMHQRTIFSLKWNSLGTMLLTGSLDNSVCLWELSNGKVKQQWQSHSDSVLDVDWNDDSTFASGSMDKSIHLFSISRVTPVHRFKGHRDEVNVVKFSPCKTLLASCSDDSTIRIWSLRNIPGLSLSSRLTNGEEGRKIDEEDRGGVFVLEGHKNDVHTIAWAPWERGKGQKKLLASASFDSTAKLWDAETGDCLHTFARHTDYVYSLQFSPGLGQYLSTGSNDSKLCVWSMKDFKLLLEYEHSGPVYELAWHPSGSQIAICGRSEDVAVVTIAI